MYGNKKSEFMSYFVDVLKEKNDNDNEKEVQQKKEENIDNRLNKFVGDIFHQLDDKEKAHALVINGLQMNLIINEFNWHKDFTEYIIGEKGKIKLSSGEVLLLYQVFVTRILYMILMNHFDNLSDYIKANDLKSKFDVLCDEFVKSIPDFKTNEDVLNFLFDKMLDAGKNKNDIDKMKREILDCVKGLLENKNNNDECRILGYEFKIVDRCKNEMAKVSSCFITNDGLETGKTKWEEDLGKGISLRQTEKIKTQNDISYSNLEPIENLLENNNQHIKAICYIKNLSEYDKAKNVENKTPISYKTLSLYLDKNNKDADRNFEAIVECYCAEHNKYLNPIIKVGIRSFKEIFTPNSVLKEYWTGQQIQNGDNKKPKNNFDHLCESLNSNKDDNFYISCRVLGMFKYKDKDENLYTHSFVLEHLNDFCYEKQLVENCKLYDKYEMITHEIKVRPEYENDFKNIKIKPNTIDRKKLIDAVGGEFLGGWWNRKEFKKDILNQRYCQCLKLIPIEQLLKTKIHGMPKEYFCDFNMLNDLDDKCENIDQMVKQIIKEAMIKNNAIKIDKNNELESCKFNKLDKKEKDNYIEKNRIDYNIFEGGNLFNIISEKLIDGIIKIRQSNHKAIEAIFKTFKYKFSKYDLDDDKTSYFTDCCNLVDDDKTSYFTDCCNLVKELCVKYEDEEEFITYKLFGIMLDHVSWFNVLGIKNYAQILFQLDNSSDNKNYKFTTDQQIGFLKLCIDQLNNINYENINRMQCIIGNVFDVMIKQNETVPLDQKVIDHLFLNINDINCLDDLICHVGCEKHSFNLSRNIVERIFDVFINDKNLKDDIKKTCLSNFVYNIVLNDKITFISSNQEQNDDIKDAKEKQKQIILSFIKMYLAKIKGNKKLISNDILNSFFKYFNDSLDTKKEIANLMKKYVLEIKKNDISRILSQTEEDDQAEIKKLFLVKGSLRFGEKKYFPKTDINIVHRDSIKSHEDYFNYYQFYEDEDDEDESYEICKKECKDDFNEYNTYRKLFLDASYSKSSNNINNSSNLSKSEAKAVPPTDSTQKENCSDWSIYFAIFLIIIIVALSLIFKEPVILFVLLVPVIILLYHCFKKRNKNNPKHKGPNFGNYKSNQPESLIDRTQNINLDIKKSGEIILNENTKSEK